MSSFVAIKNDHSCWLKFYLLWSCTRLVHSVRTTVSLYMQLFSCFWKALFLYNYPSPLPSTNFLPTIPQWCLRIWWKRCDTEVSLRVYHFVVSYSLYLGRLWVSELIAIRCNIRIFSDKSRKMLCSMDRRMNHFSGSILSLQQSNRNRFPHTSYKLSRYSFMVPITVPDMCWILWREN